MMIGPNGPPVPLTPERIEALPPDVRARINTPEMRAWIKKLDSANRPGRPSERFWAYRDAASSPEVSSARTEARRRLGETFDRLCDASAAWKHGVPSREGAAWWKHLRINEARDAVAEMLGVDPLAAMADLFPKETQPVFELHGDDAAFSMRVYGIREDHPARPEAERLHSALKNALDALDAAKTSFEAIDALNPDTSPSVKPRTWEDALLRALRPQDRVTATGLAYFEISADRKAYPADDGGAQEFKKRVEYWKQQLKRMKRKRPRLVK